MREEVLRGTAHARDIFMSHWPTDLTRRQLVDLVHALCYWQAEYAIESLPKYISVRHRCPAHHQSVIDVTGSTYVAGAVSSNCVAC